MADRLATTSSSIRAALLLFGSFAFGYNAATALHELGHVLAAWMTGGRVQALHLHPFTTSYTNISPDPSPLLTHAAGVTLGPLAGLACIALGRRFEGTYAVPLYTTGVATFATSGIYLVVGTLTGAGDARVLLDLGMPALGLLLAGGALVAAAFRLALPVVSLLGLSPGDSMWRRLLVLELGIVPYLLAMLAWHVLFNREGLRPSSGFLGAGVVLVGLMALLPVGGSLSLRPQSPASPPSLRATAVALALGAAFVLGELWWF